MTTEETRTSAAPPHLEASFPLRALPTLHRSIARAFARVALVFGCLGALLIVGIFFAGRMPSLLIRMNYDSVAYVRQMEDAMDSLRFPHMHAAQAARQARAQFEEALRREQDNITEHDEQAVVDAVRAAWTRFDAALSHGGDLAEQDAAYAALRHELDALVKVNERGMFRRLEESFLLRDALALVGALLFLTGTVWAFFQADAIAARIAHPLRRAAEVFKDRPSLQHNLRLPDPQTLEVRILFDELARLWARLGELEALNVDSLLAEKNKLEVILDSAEDAVLVLGASGVVAHVSERMLDILGLPAEAAQGKVWTDLSTTSANYLTLRGALRGDMAGVREVALSFPPTEGARHPASMHENRTEDRFFAARRRGLPGGRGQVFLLSDVTEKRRRTALRSEMMDWISHELKTPVQSLGLAADLLARRDDLDEDMTMLVSTVRQDAARLRTVAGQFMDIARMSPRALQLKPERVDLAACVAEWLEPFQLTARAGDVQLSFAAGEDVPPVEVDRERFAWVLSNLVSNALRVSKADGHVWVSVAVAPGQGAFSPAGEGCVALTVADDGPGISPALEERLFEPFSHGRTAGAKEGMVGLGLAIARTIADAHGGLIRYARRNGGGSVFTVLLPCQKVMREGSASPRPCGMA